MVHGAEQKVVAKEPAGRAKGAHAKAAATTKRKAAKVVDPPSPLEEDVEEAASEDDGVSEASNHA